MGVLDKFLNVMRLNPDEEDDFYNEDYYEDDYEEEEKPVRKNRRSEKELDFPEEDRKAAPAKDRPAKTSSKVTQMRTVKRQHNGMEVCVIKPTCVDDEREITDTLLMDRTVVLNVEGLEIETAQRIIDFTSGSCYAINGNFQKVSTYIFIITPPSVDISGDFLNMVDSLSISTPGIRFDY